MKYIKIIALVLVLISLFPVTSFAYSSDINNVLDEVDASTKEYLEALGIDEISLEKLFELSPTRVLEFIISLIFNKGEGIFTSAVRIIFTLFMIGISTSFLKDNHSLEMLIHFIGVLIILSFVIVPVSRILTDTITAIKTSTVFVNAYLPVMTAIIVASRRPALAITYNSFSLFLSSIITVVADKLFMPFISIILSFNILTSFSFDGFRERIISGLRRMVIVVLALFSTVYSGLLTTQSILATSSDTLMLRGIKFISGAFVPVVGAGIGDALSSVFSSFIIMKNTLGVFVIIVIILINLPVIVELLLWYFTLQCCSIIATMLKIDNITDILDSLSSLISLINIILFFITFVLVISTGVIISMGK